MKRTPFVHIFILTAFLANIFGPTPTARANDFYLPAPGVMVHLSPPLDPPMLKGIKVYPNNPFKFDFILDKGDENVRHPERSEGSQQEQLKQESTKLIKYFLASLTIPEQDLWVNLSPYEKDRIIPNSFGLTEMGRDLLAEDYMLKQITASLIYPEDAIGKKFWKRIYEEAAKRFGTTNIPFNTFNKVWIVPEKAVVYENAKAGTAYVVESKLKVMLEQDYLSLEKHTAIIKNTVILSAAKDLNKINSIRDSLAVPQNDINALGSQVVREIVIPELTKEVNEDKNFAQLRQVYNSLILATWYKQKIKNSILGQVYANKNKVKGLSFSNNPIENPERIYQQYLKAFKKGVYNYIKEESDPLTQEQIPRKYFSGGVDLAMAGNRTDRSTNAFRVLSGVTNAFMKMLGAGAEVNSEDITVSLVPSNEGASVVKKEEPQNGSALSKGPIPRLPRDQGRMLAFSGVNTPPTKWVEFPKDTAFQNHPAVSLMGVDKRVLEEQREEFLRKLEVDLSLTKDEIDFLKDIMGVDYFAVWVSGGHFLSHQTKLILNEQISGKLFTLYAVDKDAEKVKTLSDKFEKLSKQEMEELYPDLAKACARYYYESLIDGTMTIKYQASPATQEVIKGLRDGQKVVVIGPGIQGIFMIGKRTSGHLYMVDSNPFIVSMLQEYIKLTQSQDQIIREDVADNEHHWVDQVLKDGRPADLVVAARVVHEIGRTEGVVSEKEGNLQKERPFYSLAVTTSRKKFYNYVSHVLINGGRFLINEARIEPDDGLDAVGTIYDEIIPLGWIQKIDKQEAGTTSLFNVQSTNIWITKKDHAQLAVLGHKENNGGIDLTPANMNLETQNAGEEIKFHLNPAQLARFQNTPGFVPVIINIQPLKSLEEFLGLDRN